MCVCVWQRLIIKINYIFEHSPVFQQETGIHLLEMEICKHFCINAKLTKIETFQSAKKEQQQQKKAICNAKSRRLNKKFEDFFSAVFGRRISFIFLFYFKVSQNKHHNLQDLFFAAPFWQEMKCKIYLFILVGFS